MAIQESVVLPQLHHYNRGEDLARTYCMNHDTATTAASRRSTRLYLSLPIVLHGKDTQQKVFREDTRTLIVNRHGARLITSQQLVVGAEIVVENPAMGSVVKANVVWVGAKHDSTGRREAGIQLVESRNIWGIEFPSDDWTNDEKVADTPVAQGAPAARPASKESASVKTPPSPLNSEEIATQILQDLHETADAHARQFRERLDQVVQRIGLEVEIDLRARAGAAKEQEFAAIEQQISASSARLSALKADLDELDARLAETRQSLAATVENIPPPLTTEHTHEKIETEALPEITESGIRAAREHFQAQVEADAGQALAAWRTNLYAERDSILEEARRQIVIAMDSALEILNRDRNAGFEEMKQRIQLEILANKESAASQTQEALSLLRPKLEEMKERVVNDAVEAFRGQVSQFLGSLPPRGNE